MLGRPDISKLRAKADIPRLIAALDYRKGKDYRKNEQIRDGAVAALAELGAASIQPLVAALAEPDPYSTSLAPSNAARALARIGVPAVDPLIGALDDRRARAAATSALAQIGAPAAESLVAALRNGGAQVRIGAGDALRKIGAPAVEPLVAALDDKSEQVRAAAAETLGKIGDPRVPGPLTRALGDPAEAVRAASAKALEKLGWEPDTGEAGAAYWAAKKKWKQCVSIGGPAVAPLIAILQRADEAARPGACAALGEIGDPRSEAALVAALSDPGMRVRKAAAQALGEIGAAGAAGPLAAALADRTEEVRAAAAASLDKLGWQAQNGQAGAAYWVAWHSWYQCAELGAPAVEPLISALKDKSSRPDAARTLGEIGDPRALAPLITLLQDPDGNVQAAATGALARIGDAAVEPLIAALNDPDWQVRCCAAEALGRIGDPRAAGPLAAAMHGWHDAVKRSAALALGRIGDARAAGPLAAVLDDEQETGARREAARILAQIGDESAVEPLVAALDDPDEQVRESVAAALHRIRAEESLLPASAWDGDDYRFAYLRATKARSRLIGPSYPGEPGEVAIQFLCQQCGSPIAVPLRHLASGLMCRCCGNRVHAPAVRCYWTQCSGTYAECGGSSVERPAGEKAADEETALREAGILAAYKSAAPTDDWHDEVRELQREEQLIRESIAGYKCARCGDLSADSCQTRCGNVVCSKCARIPPSDRLPGLDALSRFRQTPRSPGS